MEFMSSLQGGVDELKPSLFELLSEQQLASLLPPSLRYLLALATHRHPRYLIRILNSFDEVYAVLMLLVERHYLKTYGGGFTENFYGLKRERMLRIKGGEVPRAQLGTPAIVRETMKLRENDVWRNLAVMVGLPYLKRKLDESYDIHAPQATLLGPTHTTDALPADATVRQRLLYYYKWFLRRVYPSVNAAYYFSLLMFNLAYLFDNSKYHSPFFWLIGTRIRRLGSADYRAIEAATNPAAAAAAEHKALRPGQANSFFSPQLFTNTIYPRLLSSLRILLPTSIFALKFLEWWHASDFARQLSRKATEGLELPAPIIAEIGRRFGRGSPSGTGESQSPSALKKGVDEKAAARPGAAAGSGSGSGSGPALNRTNYSTAHPPISKASALPILTVRAQDPSNSHLCPICNDLIATATASPYGYVYCYACIHRWVEGEHDRQAKFMAGGGNEEEAAWGEDSFAGAEPGAGAQPGASREGRWESGKGRCAVSGRRILGGTEGLRRVVV